MEAGSVYVGVSAGSIIAGPSIDIAGWGSEADKNEVGIKDLQGLNFTNIQIYPHFREELRGEIDGFRKISQNPVSELFNGEALIISDGSVKKY